MENLVVEISSLAARVEGECVSVQGWVVKLRDMKGIQFLVIRDRTGQVQITNVINDSTREIGNRISELSPESTVRVTGVLHHNADVKLDGYEIIPTSLEVFSIAERPLPVQSNTQIQSRLDWRFVDLRRPENLLIFQIQTHTEQVMRDFWRERGFIEIHSPKLMGAPSESGAELFEVKYFDRRAYLAQSPQFYKQMAMASGFDRVFEIGPVFRANPSFTSRHDTEFTSVDVETAWINSHEDIMALEEVWLLRIIQSIVEMFGSRIKELFHTEIIVPTIPFPRITMGEAIQVLSSRGHIIPSQYSGDLDPDGEKILCSDMKRRFGHDFVFVTDYPTSVRPFYHMRYEDRPTVTKSFDLLWKGLEVTTGAQREHRYDVLCQQAVEKGLNLETMKFYLDFFRYGIPPHGGYGFGLTRMLMILLGVKNVREVTYLYRGPDRLTP